MANTFRFLAAALLSVALVGAQSQFVSESSDEQSESSDEQPSPSEILDAINSFREEWMDAHRGISTHFGGLIQGIQEYMIHSLGVQLDDLTTKVHSIERMLKKAEACGKEDICGDHGHCNLHDDGESPFCFCDEGFGGQHCELTGPCDIETYNVEQRGFMPGLEIPRCDPDGYFLGMQYMGSQAICVTRLGEQIEGYSVPRWETGDDMKCDCARDQLLENHIDTVDCLPNGNHIPLPLPPDGPK